MLVNVDNPALNISDGPALLLVRSLQHRAAAGVEGWGALCLHLGGERVLEGSFTLDIINLVIDTVVKLMTVKKNNLRAVFGVAWHLLDHADMDIVGVTITTGLYIITDNRVHQQGEVH